MEATSTATMTASTRPAAPSPCSTARVNHTRGALPTRSPTATFESSYAALLVELLVVRPQDRDRQCHDHRAQDEANQAEDLDTAEERHEREHRRDALLAPDEARANDVVGDDADD